MTDAQEEAALRIALHRRIIDLIAEMRKDDPDLTFEAAALSIGLEAERVSVLMPEAEKRSLWRVAEK